MELKSLGQSRLVATRMSPWLLLFVLCGLPVASALGGGSGGNGSTSEGGIPTWVEYAKRIKSTQEISALENGFSGEHVSLSNGATSFSVIDIDVPGNFNLPVQLSRNLAIDLQPQDGIQPYDSLLRGAGNWDVDVPFMAATYPTSTGWIAQRCSQGSVPDLAIGPDMTFYRGEVWQGIAVHVPNRGDVTALGLDTPVPVPSSGGPYRLTTAERDVFDCIPMKSGLSGEGFRMTTTAGVRYYFDVGTIRTAAKLRKSIVMSVMSPDVPPVMVYLERNRYYLLASKIEDRFGNTVQFQYDTDGHPTRIWASDGREITFAYSSGRLSSATSHGRTWQYQYDASAQLTTVVRPDASHWQYAYSDSLMPSTAPDIENLVAPWCQGSPAIIGAAFTLTATHPGGATASFRFENHRHYRSGVHASECEKITAPLGPFDEPAYELRVPYFFDVMSLTQKTLSGPGMPSGTWNYSYDYGASLEHLWGTHTEPANYPCTTCKQYKTTIVTNPDGTQQRYRFGMVYTLNDGRLLQTDTLRADGSVIRSEVNQYLSEAAAANQPFYAQYGHVLGAVADPLTARIRPKISTVITQDGATFANTTNTFDAYGRATEQTESSSLGYSRVNQTTYYDNTSKWILGQIAQRKIDGTTVSSMTFDATTASPLTYSSFGSLKQVVTWNNDGTLATVKDGNNHVTTASNWKRGIPQSIGHPDGTSESVGVNDAGWITWVKDQNNFITHYDYDLMGRLASITYPTGDAVSWNQTLLSFEQVASNEYGIPGGHWKQTVHTANGYTVTYFDGMWRPLVTEHYDSANKASTLSQLVQRYDATGRKTFASYPTNNLTSYASASIPGALTSYDALDRVTEVQKDSDLGTLTSTTAYLSGFRTAVTDPRNNITTTAYMAFDEPTTDWPVSVTAPENITQTISRDVFGNPTSITQSGLYGTESDSITKGLFYDSHHRLCRTTEPESGSTVLAYDGSDNVLWSAAGLAITGTGCGLEQVTAAAMTTRSYDAMNRVKTILSPAGTESTSYDYDPVGHLTSAQSGASTTWNGTYNSRGMLTGESLHVAGQSTWAIGYDYDANGQKSALHYPDGESVSYFPNGMGQPTQVGSYVGSIGYFPNGQVKQLLYGNGAGYIAEQNARQLLSNFSYGMGGTPQLSEDLAYDKNGNITTVADLAGGPRNKSFTYDALNRLTSATAAGLWGNQIFTYDPLNNLRSLQTGSQTSTYHYDTSNKLASISGPVPINYTYDPRGNVASKNSMNLVFDQKNQLMQIPGIGSYAYDASGRRVSKTTAGGTTYYFYSQAGQLMYQWAPSLARSTNFIYLGTKMVARNVSIHLGAVASIGFDANPNDGAYTVHWDAVAGATSYVLQESANGGAWSTVYSGSATNAALTGRVGGSYVYRVEGCIDTICGTFTSSATLGVRPTLPTLTVPTGIINGTYTVSWTAPASASSYEVQERLNGGAWATIASGTSATSTSRPGTTTGSYTYQVAAHNAYGTRGWASSGAVTVNTDYGVMPSPLPSYSVPATNATGIVAVSWTAASPVTQYTLQQSNDGGAGWSTTYAGVGTSATLSGLADGGYSYRLRACNDTGGNSVCTGWVAAGPMVVTHPPTTAPTLNVPASSATGTYTVSWSGVPGPVSYTLQESANGGDWSTVQANGMTNWGASGHGNGSYGYRVQACNAGGCGPWSGTKSTTVLLLPPTPTNITIPATSNGPVALSWAASATATSYTLQHAKYGVTGWSTIYGGSATSYTQQETTTGTWIYQVQACNASGCSAFRAGSAGVIVTIPPSNAPNLSVPASSNTGSFSVSWGTVSGATSYFLQEQVNGGGWSAIQSSSATNKALTGKGNGSYGYRVEACNAGGCGPWSSPGTITVALTPAAPAAVTAPSYVHGTPYTISWSASSGSTSYNVRRTDLDTGSSGIVGTTSNTNIGMAAPVRSNTFQFAVQACNASGCSGFTNASSTTYTDRKGAPNIITPVPLTPVGSR